VRRSTSIAGGFLLVASIHLQPQAFADAPKVRTTPSKSFEQPDGVQPTEESTAITVTEGTGRPSTCPFSADDKPAPLSGMTIHSNGLVQSQGELRNAQGEIIGWLDESGCMEPIEPSKAIERLQYSIRDVPITIMKADFTRPYVYAVQSDATSATLLFINANTEQVEKILPIGANATDMSINYGEGRLYITNFGSDHTQVVNLETQELLAPLSLGTDVDKINAGRPGRIYFEDSRYVNAVDTGTGVTVGRRSAHRGDGEIDPTGTVYYHCDDNISSARIYKLDISTETITETSTSLVHRFGSRNLVLSGDGGRLFWQGYVYDADLNELGSLGSEIYATTLYGDLAFGEHEVFDAHNGEVVYALPVSSTVMSVSGDQNKLFLFDSVAGEIVAVPMSEISMVPGPGLNPDPADGGTVNLSLDHLDWSTSPVAVTYDVYLGDSLASVAAAGPGSPEHFGNVAESEVALPTPLGPGETLYWRVDVVSHYGVLTGDVWSFLVAPIAVQPGTVSVVGVTNAADPRLDLTLTAGTGVVDWVIEETSVWLIPDHVSGTTPDTVELSFDTAGLSPGAYLTEMVIRATGGVELTVPVRFDLVPMALTEMVTDHGHHFVYGLQRGSGSFDDSLLLFINTETEQVEKVLPVGSNATDLSINHGEGRLYISNWLRPITQVVDLLTKMLLPPLSLGTDVYKINAGRPGRITFEEEDQWIHIKVVDSTTGSVVGQAWEREGDGEIDPTGTFYYHCDNNISNAHIHKFDISTDTFTEVGASEQHAYGSRNLVMSGDGGRFFWRGYVYDADLNELGSLGSEIHATTLYGDLAFGEDEVFDARTGAAVYTLPVSSTVMSVSGDQTKAFVFDGSQGRIVVVPMSDIAPVPGPHLTPDPADGETLSLPLERLEWSVSPAAISYDVYFGDVASSVGAANPGSPEFQGNVTGSEIDLTAALGLGATYFWRVDVVGYAGIVTGDVWTFHVAPIVVTPKKVSVSTLAYTIRPEIELMVSADGGTVAWRLTENTPWLVPDHTQGSTPDTVIVGINTSLMAPGTYNSEMTLQSGSSQFTVPVELELLPMDLTKMVTDYDASYVYGLRQGEGDPGGSQLLFINTESEQVERVITVGSNATDMSINYGERRLYITNWLGENTQVIDLLTRELLPPLPIGTSVDKINAGRAGRIYTETRSSWTDVKAIDTVTGSVVGQSQERVGDAEVDPTGTSYYHCDNNISNAHIHKLDISTDSFDEVAVSVEHAYGSRNLVMSGNGSRLFWRGFVYDEDLNELGSLGTEIYASTLHGELAIGEFEVFDTLDWAPIYTLPASSKVMAVSGDLEKVFVFDPTSSRIVVIPMSEIGAVQGPALTPDPADGETVHLPLDRLDWSSSPVALSYNVYFGSDLGSVKTANPASPEYLGSVIASEIDLTTALSPGQTYFWRVDSVTYSIRVPGEVWSFQSAPIVVSPGSVSVKAVAKTINPVIELEISAAGNTVDWVLTGIPQWLIPDQSQGSTPDTVSVVVDITGLATGTHTSELVFQSEGAQVPIPVDLELFPMALTTMAADPGDHYVYGLQRGSPSADEAFLLFINTETEQIDGVLPVGSNATDMSLSPLEGRLYVTNFARPHTQVIDLETRNLLPPLALGTDVFKINTGRTGRIYYEESNQWIYIKAVDSVTGIVVGQSNEREGDGEVDPTGSFYYHCDNNISNAHIHKLDISTDALTEIAASGQHPYGSRSLVLSADGSRLFWQGYVYDANLNELGSLGSEIYGTTARGDLAFGENEVFKTDSGVAVATLPVSSTVMVVAGDQQKLFLFDPSQADVIAIPLAEISPAVFSDGFESGDPSRWSAVYP